MTRAATTNEKVATALSNQIGEILVEEAPTHSSVTPKRALDKHDSAHHSIEVAEALLDDAKISVLESAVENCRSKCLQMNWSEICDETPFKQLLLNMNRT